MFWVLWKLNKRFRHLPLKLSRSGVIIWLAQQSMNPNVSNSSVSLDPIGPVALTSDQVQITDFAVPVPTAQAGRGLYQDGEDIAGISQDIVKICSRPYRHTTLNWQSSQAVGSMIHTFDPLQHVLSQPMVWNVLAPFRYFRCTARVRFQISGNAFLGGKLIAAWIPPNRINSFCDGWFSLTTLSGIPQRVEMYPTENSTYELEIPLLMSSRWLDLDQTVNGGLFYNSAGFNSEQLVTLGVVGVWVASALVSEDTIDSSAVSMFVSLENFQLETAYRLNFPALLPPIPTVTPLTKFLPFGSKFVNQVSAIWFGIDPTLLDEKKEKQKQRKAIQVFNSGTSAGEARQKESSGWVSGPVRTVAQMASVFFPFSGTFSPLVAAVNATASGLASVLSYFNLDKPRMMALPTQIISNYRGIAHSDGIDQVNSLALSSDNAVSAVGLNQPFDPEALEISRIASIPQVISSKQVVTSMAASTVIMQWSVAPLNVPIVGTNSALNIDSAECYAYCPTFASWAAAPFRFWRGTCVIDVEVVAQAFSKMYLGLSWQPGFGEFAVPVTTVASGTETELLTQIVQVSGNTRARFVIPYKAGSHWLRNDMNAQFNATNSSIFQREKTGRVNGTFTMYVVNPLTSYSASGPNLNPVTVFTSVSFPDLQVARPTGVNLCSVRGGNYVALQPVGFSEKKQVFNSGESSSDTPSAQLSHNHWFGDKITSIMDVTRRPTSIGFMIGTGVQFASQSIWSLFNTIPQMSKPLPTDVSTAAESFGNALPYPNNFAVWFSNIYLAWRGEVSYQLVAEIGGNTTSTQNFLPSSNRPAVKLTNTDAWDFTTFPFLSTGRPTFNVGYTPSASTYTDGTFYKPMYNVDIPIAASVPYYSESTFQMTIDPGLPAISGSPTTFTFFGAPYVTGAMPGVNVTVQPPASQNVELPFDAVRFTMLASTGDNFSYGALYPPGVITDYITDGSQSFPLSTTASTYSLPPTWITSVP
jgi:hypothetical protein